ARRSCSLNVCSNCCWRATSLSSVATRVRSRNTSGMPIRTSIQSRNIACSLSSAGTRVAGAWDRCRLFGYKNATRRGRRGESDLHARNGTLRTGTTWRRMRSPPIDVRSRSLSSQMFSERVECRSPLCTPLLQNRGSGELRVRHDDRQLATGFRQQIELHGGAVPFVATTPLAIRPDDKSLGRRTIERGRQRAREVRIDLLRPAPPASF